MAWRKAVLAAGTILFVSTTTSWAGFSPYDDYPGSYDPYDYQADSHDPHWLMDERSGCWAYDSNAGPMNSITWSGDCRNGRADGDGTLTFFERGRQIERLTGSFADGLLQDGHVQIAWSDGSSYDGDEVHGQFNGLGVLIATDGTRYDGRWQDDNFVGPANRNPYLTGNGETHSDRAPGVADNEAPSVENEQTQQQQPAAHWPFLDGSESKLAAADGSVLSFSVGTGGVLKRSIVHADGSVADTTLTPDSDNSGSVRNQRGLVVASYRLDNDALDITYSNGRTETIAANGAGGLTVTTTPPGGLSIKSDWYPEDRVTTTARNDAAPAKSGAAPSPSGPTPPPAAPSAKLQVASLAPQHAAPSVHADGTREVEPEARHATVTHSAVHEAKLVDTPFHPSLRPAAPVEVAENLPHPDLKPARASQIAAEDLPRPDVKPAPPPEQVQVAENLRPEQKPALHLSKKRDRHHAHTVVASTAPEQQPVEMHAEVLPPPPEVHTVAIPDLRDETPVAAAVAHTTAAAHTATVAPAPVHAAVASAAPAAPSPTTPVHIAALHTIGAPEPALRKSASDCVTVESNGTHWGFRNNCVTDIQFAYCVKNGADRLTACGDSAVPGSVAAHGFTSLIADLSMKDPSASHAFRWVACIGGAGEVVPRLDQSDPPMGRCLHTSDLPSGVERADAMKRTGK
jgi:hypothetical protein